ncbi:MAG: MATE family efflux transporter [Minicystis sp.]
MTFAALPSPRLRPLDRERTPPGPPPREEPHASPREHRTSSLALARELWALASPAIAHMFLITLVFLASRAMVGRYSSAALASLQISGTLTWLVYTLFTAFSSGTLAVVARSVGAGDRLGAARAARAALLLAIALGLLVALPLRIANGSLLALLFPHASAAVLADAGAYLHIVLPALPLAFVEAIAAAAFQGAGDTRTPLYVATLGNIVNVTLSALLIFGGLGLPELGIRGAAIGTAATMSIEGLLLGALLLSQRGPLPLGGIAPESLRDRLSLTRLGWGGAALRRVLNVSAPTFAEKLVNQSAYLGFVAMIGLLGPEAMAGNQALVAIEAICFLTADGFGVAAGATLARKLGAGKPDEAARAGWMAAFMAAAWLSTMGLLFALVPRLLMRGFTSDPAIITLGARALMVAAIAQPFMAMATVLGMGLRAAGDTRTVLGVTFLSSMIVRLVATYFFAITLGYGLLGIWMGSTADWICRSALLGIAYGRGRWRSAQV